MIGIFGGTFDPIHYGHLRTALEVAEHFGLTSMYLIPGKVPPHRPQPQANAAQRLAMLQAAVANEPTLVIDDRELKREGLSYTVLTLESLRAELGEQEPILLTLGVDAFLHFQTWYRWQDILNLAHLVVVHRPGYRLPPQGWYTEKLTESIQTVTANAGNVFTLGVTQLDISATHLRALLNAGKNARYLLPDSVIDYIQRYKLYSGTEWN